VGHEKVLESELREGSTGHQIYGWFIEGFDTKDLQEAKAPLHELD